MVETDWDNFVYVSYIKYLCILRNFWEAKIGTAAAEVVGVLTEVTKYPIDDFMEKCQD